MGGGSSRVRKCGDHCTRTTIRCMYNFVSVDKVLSFTLDSDTVLIYRVPDQEPKVDHYRQVVQLLKPEVKEKVFNWKGEGSY